MTNPNVLPAPLSAEEAYALTATKLWLMHSERCSEDDIGRQHIKSLITDQHLARTIEFTRRNADDLAGQTGPRTHGEWIEFLDQRDAVTATWRCLATPERGLLFLLELSAFSPWGPPASAAFLTDEATRERRQDALTLLVTNTSGILQRKDSMQVDKALKKSLRKVAALPMDRVKLFGVAGVATLGGVIAGALTGGLAAPAVGTAIGGSAGLSGAAATSAGLALLGGGSLASGGFGMAGGMALVAGIGGAAGAVVAGAPAAVAGSHYLGGTSPDELIADCAKLVTTAKSVIAGRPEGRDDIRRIRDEVSARRDQLGSPLQQLGGLRRFTPRVDGLSHKCLVLDNTLSALDSI